MKQAEEFHEIMDIRGCAKYLHISPDTLYFYASTKIVPAFKLGNRWRFKKTMIDEWIDGKIEKERNTVKGTG